MAKVKLLKFNFTSNYIGYAINNSLVAVRFFYNNRIVRKILYNSYTTYYDTYINILC